MAWVPFRIVPMSRRAAGAWLASHRAHNAATGDSTASTHSATTTGAASVLSARGRRARARAAIPACLALLALGLANLLGGLALGAGAAASTRTMLEAIHANFGPFGWAMLLCACAAVGGPARGPFATAGVLCGVALGGLTAAGLLCVCYQAARGAVIEPALYLHGLYFNLAWPALHLAGLGACAQTLTRRPWLGVAIAAALHLGLNVAFDHPLLAFGAPVSPWSEMNGYGAFLWPHLIAGIYWTAWTALLLIGAECWRRRRASRNLFVAAWVAAVLCALSGAWTVRNTPPEPTPARPTPATGAQPTYTRLDLDVEFEPGQHRIRSRGAAVVANQHNAAIPVLRFAFDPGVTVHRLRLTGERLENSHPRHRSYRLNRPLAPKETLKVTFDIERADHPFDRRQRLLANGASAALADLVPPLGSATDVAVALRIRVGTSLDQIAIAPGRPTGQWSENGRRFFAFEADAPVPLLAQVHSGRYAIARAAWRGVAINVYHHPTHTGHAPSLVRLAKRALSRWTADGAYSHNSFHLVETPDYRAIARPPSLLTLGWRSPNMPTDVAPRPRPVVAYSESYSDIPKPLGCTPFLRRGSCGSGRGLPEEGLDSPRFGHTLELAERKRRESR